MTRRGRLVTFREIGEKKGRTSYELNLFSAPAKQDQIELRLLPQSGLGFTFHNLCQCSGLYGLALTVIGLFIFLHIAPVLRLKRMVDFAMFCFSVTRKDYIDKFLFLLIS